MSIQCNQLSKKFGKRHVIHQLDLTLDLGKCHIIVGPNGAGKTTLLKMLAGLTKPCSGNVLTYQQPICHRMIRDYGIVYVPNQPWPFTETVFENVALPLKVRGVSKSDIKVRVMAILARFDLTHLANQRATTLSAGEGQKLALCRAMVINPKILYLDEPTSNIDVDTVPIIEAYLKAFVAQDGGTLVMVSHDNQQTQRMADCIWQLSENGITQDVSKLAAN